MEGRLKCVKDYKKLEKCLYFVSNFYFNPDMRQYAPSNFRLFIPSWLKKIVSALHDQHKLCLVGVGI